MSDELSKNIEHQPEAKRESQLSNQRSDPAARTGDSLGPFDKAAFEKNAAAQELPQRNEARPSSESPSRLNFPLQSTVEASGATSDSLDGQGVPIHEKSDSAAEVNEAQPTSTAGDKNGRRNEANPPEQAELDENGDALETLTEDDLRVLRSYDEVLARGDDPDRRNDLNGNTKESFVPSPLIDLARYVDEYGRKVVGVCLFTESEPTLPCGPSREFGGRRYYVPQLPPGLYDSMLLPDGTRGYESIRKLFDSIHRLLHGYLMLSEKPSALLTYWCIATWFPDVLDFVPRLTITGPRHAVDLLFRMLRCACRRPLLLADLSPAVLKLIPINELMPTLFIYETRRSRRTEELLDAGNRKGYFVPSSGKLHQCYCAKCIYFGEEYTPERSLLDGIHIHVVRNASLPDRALSTDEEIQNLQNRLFLYRCLKRELVAASRYAPGGLVPELSAVAKQLGACIVDDTDLQRRIADLLKEQNEQVRVDRSVELKGAVLRAVLWHCHQNDEKVHTSNIAVTVNAMYREEGESLRVSSETVGHVLKNLGLYSIRLGRDGRGLRLDKATQLRAHELSLAYGVLPTAPECGHCHTFQAIEL